MPPPSLSAAKPAADSPPRSASKNKEPSPRFCYYDAIIVGSGLAGMVTAVTILDRGGNVLILEKESKLGGNSMKASSGINGIWHSSTADSKCSFYKDTHKSHHASDDHNCSKDKPTHEWKTPKQSPSMSNESNLKSNTRQNETSDAINNPRSWASTSPKSKELMATLVKKSEGALRWLHERAGVSFAFDHPVQLGGHSHPRTYQPVNGTIGFELISKLSKILKEWNSVVESSSSSSSSSSTNSISERGSVTIITNAKVDRLIQRTPSSSCILFDASSDIVPVAGVRVQRLHTDATTSDENPTSSFTTEVFRSKSVVLATGGFAANLNQILAHSDKPIGMYASSSSSSFPNAKLYSLLRLPTTSGPWATGDALDLARATHASMVDLDQIQVHPTGFINPSDPNNQSKILAAECLRSVGGLLLDRYGQRFCNELATRKSIADKMMAMSSSSTSSSNVFSLVLSLSASNAGADPHVNFYKKIGLLQVVHGIDELAEWFQSSVSHEIAAERLRTTLRTTLRSYQDSAKCGLDEFGKVVFRNVPAENLSTETFVVGQVTPVVHYCMGGIGVDCNGRVLRKKKSIREENGYNDDTTHAMSSSSSSSSSSSNSFSSSSTFATENTNHPQNDACVPGLYAVGEVTGGLHGRNRLGGNSLLECVVFGRLVGEHVPLPTNHQHDGSITGTTKTARFGLSPTQSALCPSKFMA